MSESVSIEVALTRRRSVRKFTDASVPDDVIDDVIEMASRSPSWCNTQSWKAYLVRNPEIVILSQDLVRAAQERDDRPDLEFPGKLEGVLYQRKKEADNHLREARTGSSVVNPREEISALYENWTFFGAQQAVFLTVPRSNIPYALVDLGCFLQSILLALESRRLAGCPQASLAQFPHVVRQHLPIPVSEAIVCGISFGPPQRDTSAVRTPRIKVDEILWRRSAATVPSRQGQKEWN